MALVLLTDKKENTNIEHTVRLESSSRRCGFTQCHIPEAEHSPWMI